jgi:MurNAc alpha-1-phosphate uridylyltransferase
VKAIVLAAGRGERLRPITDTLPKPLVPVGGKPLIAYHLAALSKAGIRDVVINLSWLGARIQEVLGDGSDYGVRIRYSEEGPVALETGGGIFHAMPLLGPAPFLVVNGDVFTNIDFAGIRLSDDADACIVLVPNPDHHQRGDFALQGDAVVERETERFTYSGIGIFRPEFFAGCSAGKFPLAPLLKRAIAAGRLHGVLHRGGWCDVGSPDRLAKLDAEVRAGMRV